MEGKTGVRGCTTHLIGSKAKNRVAQIAKTSYKHAKTNPSVLVQPWRYLADICIYEDALAASGHYDSFARGKGNSRGRGRGLPGVKPSHPYQVLMAHSKVTRSKDVIIAMDAFILQLTAGIKQETRRLAKSNNLVASPLHRKMSPSRTVMPSSRRHALELSNLAAGSPTPVLQST